MFSRLSKLSKSFRAASLWSKALDSAAEKDYTAALTCLKSIYDIFKTSIPSERVTCDVNILCANVACKLGDYNLSVAAVTIAVSQLNCDAAELSKCDRDYLAVYCKNLLEYCAQKTKDPKVASAAASIKADFDSALLQRVRRDITRNFPISGLT
jgi:hypothetical protein